MAASIVGVFDETLQKAICDSKVLVVGAGGIGCEILKNLIMTGFTDIEIIDLDTIDVSNLNRQFLFHKKHVGRSKAAVAKETALTFNPDAKIIDHHDSITSPDFGSNFFKKFSLVMNALDNRAARNHVNRMCLATDVPLIESGTAGYEGQVELIKKGLGQCYECNPKASQKTYPGCTIRNTPSEPIHCIVWAKHLFNQLFGEEDPDQDVSPDTADPEAAGGAGEGALETPSNQEGNVQRVSTRSWAQSCDYDPQKLFTKLFHDDIKYLLSMDNLWKKRRPPVPLLWTDLPDGVPGCSKDADSSRLLKDQRHWSIAKCAKIFSESLEKLGKAFALCREKSANDHLVWDKDDTHAMDFVAACAIIRCYIFGIPQKTRFDIKSMAGNIIPAIATTNAIVAGVVILHAFRILRKNYKACKSVYLRQKVNHRNQLLVPEKYVNPPNPKCYVCAPTPQAVLAADISKMTLRELEELVLKNALNMIAPDVMLDDGTGTVLLSSEEGETEENNDKILEELGIRDGMILKVDDFQQNYSLTLTITYREKPAINVDAPEFLILADDQTKFKPEADSKSLPSPTPPPASTSNGRVPADDGDTVVESLPSRANVAKKRRTVSPEKDSSSKKRKIQDNDDCIMEISQDVENESVPKDDNCIDDDDDDDCDCILIE